MKILLISGFYPPFAPASGTRMSKFSKYLLAAGHDIRVIGCANTHLKKVLPLEIPEHLVTYAPLGKYPPWLDWLARRDRQAAVGPEAKSAPAQNPVQKDQSAGTSIIKMLRRRLSRLVYLPDRQICWTANAVEVGRKIMRDWQPDIIYVSAPPHSGLFVARRLGREFGVKWVPEFRDLWVDHPYYVNPGPIRTIEKFLERNLLKDAAGLVTVTQTWARHLEKLWPQPVVLSMNGFDPDDYGPWKPAPFSERTEQKLTLLYAGSMYLGMRDPTVLFEAFKRMGDRARKIKAVFYPLDAVILKQLVEAYDVSDIVEIRPVVPRTVILEELLKTDIALLLRWNDPREEGVLAGKLFEYIGAGRPILSVGAERGEAADIILQNDIGAVSNDPAQIAGHLDKWLMELETTGRIAGIPDPVKERFARATQFQVLEEFFDRIVSD